MTDQKPSRTTPVRLPALPDGLNYMVTIDGLGGVGSIVISRNEDDPEEGFEWKSVTHLPDRAPLTRYWSTLQSAVTNCVDATKAFLALKEREEQAKRAAKGAFDLFGEADTKPVTLATREDTDTPGTPT